MRRTFTQHLGALGEMPIDTVTRDDVQGWLDDQVDRGYSFKTIKDRRGALGSVFREWCREHGGTNPVEGTHNDGELTTFEPVFLKTWEVDAIIEQLPTEQDRVYVEVLVSTGMRKGEALALRVADLDLRGDGGDESAITVDKARKHSHAGAAFHRVGTTKTRAGRRVIGIDDDLANILRAFVSGRAPADLVFDLGNEGTWQNNHWAPARARAKLDKNPRIHDLRHTYASLLLAEGEDLHKVSKQLGHKDYNTTANIYGHLDRSGSRGVAKVFGKARNRQPVRKLRVV
jgi:integrase